MFRTATVAAIAAAVLVALPGAAGAAATDPSGPSELISRPGPAKLSIVTAAQKTNLKGMITVKIRTYRQLMQGPIVTGTVGVTGMKLTVDVIGFNDGSGYEDQQYLQPCVSTTDSQGYLTCTFTPPTLINGRPATSFLAQALYDQGSHSNWLQAAKAVTIVK
ncbi:hypothetical protein DSM112329_02004 [Paraconexibacter sp. AEG42_29]|uniref:DUF2155 domain-containing protein n=1 Tax=Paraconexibacter sp. AEG42_29 TaxID=2997339 RepID=A0AAU7ATY6_9ACTN